MISAAMASALNTRSGEGLPACAVHAHITRPRQTACRATVPLRKPSPLRRAQDAGGQSPHSGSTQWDQNSAGKYPLISRPTQISTRVGVIHDMAFFLLGCGDKPPFLNAPPPSGVKQHFA